MPKELQLTGPRQLAYNLYEEPPLKRWEVRARAVVSGISHGTEINLYRGTAPFHSRDFDQELRLFVDSPGYQPYPRTLGYEWVGRVCEVGREVSGFRVGDMVQLPHHHAETCTFSAAVDQRFGGAIALPADVDTDTAAVMTLAGTALLAVQHGQLKLGDRVGVFGLGAIGLLALQFARLDGASWVVAVDPIARRRALAQEYGADLVLDPTACDPGLVIKSMDRHRGVDVAIDTSGHYAALHQAIRSARMGGRIVAAGYYQGGGTALRLGEEWLHNRLTMVSSMGVWGCPHRQYPVWDRARVQAIASQLLLEGKVRASSMVTHRFPFGRAAEAYDLVDRHPEETVKVVLTYD